MKIEILKSAKGNEQKQNKPAKSQAGPHAKKTRSKGKESSPKIGLHT